MKKGTRAPPLSQLAQKRPLRNDHVTLKTPQMIPDRYGELISKLIFTLSTFDNDHTQDIGKDMDMVMAKCKKIRHLDYDGVKGCAFCPLYNEGLCKAKYWGGIFSHSYGWGVSDIDLFLDMITGEDGK